MLLGSPLSMIFYQRLLYNFIDLAAMSASESHFAWIGWKSLVEKNKATNSQN